MADPIVKAVFGTLYLAPTSVGAGGTPLLGIDPGQPLRVAFLPGVEYERHGLEPDAVRGVRETAPGVSLLFIPAMGGDVDTLKLMFAQHTADGETVASDGDDVTAGAHTVRDFNAVVRPAVSSERFFYFPRLFNSPDITAHLNRHRILREMAATSLVLACGRPDNSTAPAVGVGSEETLDGMYEFGPPPDPPGVVEVLSPYAPWWVGTRPYSNAQVLPQLPSAMFEAASAGNTCNDHLHALATALADGAWAVLVEDDGGNIDPLDVDNLPATIVALRCYPPGNVDFTANFAVIIAGVDGSNPAVTMKLPDTTGVSIDGVLLFGYATGAFSSSPSNPWTNANPFDAGTFSGFQRWATLSGATLATMQVYLSEESIIVHGINTAGTAALANRVFTVGNNLERTDAVRRVSSYTSGGGTNSFGTGTAPPQPFGTNTSPLRHGATANTEAHAMEGTDTLYCSLNEMLGDNSNNLWLLDANDNPIIERIRMASLTTLRSHGLLRNFAMIQLPTGQVSGTPVLDGGQTVGWIIHDRGAAAGGTRREGWFIPAVAPNEKGELLAA